MSQAGSSSPKKDFDPNKKATCIKRRKEEEEEGEEDDQEPPSVSQSVRQTEIDSDPTPRTTKPKRAADWVAAAAAVAVALLLPATHVDNLTTKLQPLKKVTS
jgi:hypothetical protein